MNSKTMRATLSVTKALSDIQRVRILMMLRPGELCVCQIIEVLALAPSTVSKHLSILSGAGLVDCRKDGRWMYYRLPAGTEGAFIRPILKWLGETLDNDKTVIDDRKKLSAVVATELNSLCLKQRIRSDKTRKEKAL